ncbi:MAG: helix-turn-helix domain-containing protein [Lachnospiraceae bacterium]|nr:helix-turn-helix domain-containing protein [Lachnospiraceae bacterium]
MSKYYSINDVAMMTGLSTRTIRNYIKMNLLDGEKVDGVWQFTEENFQSFVENPNVKPSIQAKSNAIVYDFMLDNHKKENEICMIVDFTEEEDDVEEISGFFCEQINNNYVDGLKFAFHKDEENYRVILKGYAEVVMKIMNDYYNL